jgi:hypothetical protein
MEKLELVDALESGKGATSSLDDALRRPGVGSVSDHELGEIRDSVREQLEWAEQMAERLRRDAEARAREALSRAGENERAFAERAERLSERGLSGEAALPDDVTERLAQARDVMQRAAEALASGRGEEGVERQREAQRLLEQSDTGKTRDHDEQPERPSKSGHDQEASQEIAIGGNVPPKAEQKQAEEFRRRVLRGLAEQKSDRLSPAVKRYAEGLLR